MFTLSIKYNVLHISFLESHVRNLLTAVINNNRCRVYTTHVHRPSDELSTGLCRKELILNFNWVYIDHN